MLARARASCIWRAPYLWCSRSGEEERAQCGRHSRSGANSAYANQLWMQHRFATAERGGMYVFDREAKKLQKNRAASSPDAATYDYLRDEVAAHVVERVCDIARPFPSAVDVGCGRGHIAKQLPSNLIASLCQCDMAEEALASECGQ